MNKRLEKMIERGKLPHALALCGSSEVTEATALDLAEKLLGKRTNHPDLHHYHPEGKLGMHTMEKLRQLQQEIALYPYEGKVKIFILHSAERMLPTSSNALLKTLEEPSEASLLILLTDKKEKLLPTLVSRLQLIHCDIPNHPLTPFQNDFFTLLQAPSFASIAAFASGFEKEKKGWEKELLKTLPKELTATQREVQEKEIEGTIALRSYDEVFSLFETMLLVARDQAFLDHAKTHFDAATLRHMPRYDYDKTEKRTRSARLQIERGATLQTTLEWLLMS